MDLNFRQQSVGETVYLVLDKEDDWEIDSFAMNMMARNRMTNIVPAQMIQMNDRQQMQFNITGLAKLNGRIARPRPKKEVLPVLNSILNAFEEADAYMLDMEHLLLEWEYVYLDGNGNCMFLYLPFNYAYGKDKIAFLQDVVSRIQPDYQEKDPYLFDILNAFSRGAIQKLSDFREIIKKCAGITPAGYGEEEKRKPETGLNGQNLDADGRRMQEGEKEILQTEKKETDNYNAGKTEKRIEKKTDRKEEKKAERKAPGGSKIPVINIPGREPGAKAVPQQMQPETDNGGKKNAGEGKKDKKKGFFGRKETGRQNSFQNTLFIPGKKKGEETDTLEVRGSQAADVTDAAFSVNNSRGNWPNGMYEGYENTVIIQEPASVHRDNENTVMLEPSEASGMVPAGFIRRQDGSRYLIRKDRVMIGSGTAADICIASNSAISRSHAVVSCINGSYFMEDNQSKNGSFINGRRLQPGMREPLYDGMTVRLANEDFEFYKEL